jgi:hypothetical protein
MLIILRAGLLAFFLSCIHSYLLLATCAAPVSITPDAFVASDAYHKTIDISKRSLITPDNSFENREAVQLDAGGRSGSLVSCRDPSTVTCYSTAVSKVALEKCHPRSLRIPCRRKKSLDYTFSFVVRVFLPRSKRVSRQAPYSPQCLCSGINLTRLQKAGSAIKGGQWDVLFSICLTLTTLISRSLPESWDCHQER